MLWVLSGLPAREVTMVPGAGPGNVQPSNLDVLRAPQWQPAHNGSHKISCLQHRGGWLLWISHCRTQATGCMWACKSICYNLCPMVVLSDLIEHNIARSLQKETTRTCLKEKLHSIICFLGRAMKCLLWVFWRKLTMSFTYNGTTPW